jgi:AsmA-like C-terminal region
MTASSRSEKRHRIHVREVIVTAVIAALMITAHLMFFFWPFRYREVHPLLERTFRSKVDVSRYHRTYFPHPGFVAENVTFYRHGDTHIPPLATMKRMTVEGNWLALIFHPHRLAVIRIDGLHVQIPPVGTQARGMDFDQGVISTSQSEMQIETISADHTNLDFLRHDQPPLEFQFARLQIHNVQQNHPLTFSINVNIPEPHGTVTASGSLGPFRTASYGTTPLSGSYMLQQADLKGIDGLSGTARAQGSFRGNFSQVDTTGQLAIPNFRAGDAHAVEMDAAYHVLVNGENGDVRMDSVQLQTANSRIDVQGTVEGSPKQVSLAFSSKEGDLHQLLRVVEQGEPTVTGKVSFNATAQFGDGEGDFLKRLGLKGQVAVDHVQFVTGTRQTVDAFSARVSADPPGEKKDTAPQTAPVVFASASSHTEFRNGVAYLPDVSVSLPGAAGKLHGTFNLENTKIDLTGTGMLQRSLSHAATGFKAFLLKPISPFFHHHDAGAVVSVAVTGTCDHPNVTQNVLHDKK